MCLRRDMSDHEEYSGDCAHSEYFPGSITNLFDVHQKGQRRTRTTIEIMEVCRAHVTMIHGMQTVDAPGTHTFFVRVGFYPLLEGKKAFCCHVFTGVEK